MTHQHQFIKIEEITRRLNLPGSQVGIQDTSVAVTGPVWRDEYGAKVGCPLCGEIRVIWGSGEVVIEIQGHESNDTTINN